MSAVVSAREGVENCFSSVRRKLENNSITVDTADVCRAI